MDQAINPSVVQSFLVFAAGLVGASAGVFGTFLTVRATHQAELRRAAIDAGFREWQGASDMHLKLGGKAALFPPAIFVYYNLELLKLLDDNNLTADSYHDLTERQLAFKTAIEKANAR